MKKNYVVLKLRVQLIVHRPVWKPVRQHVLGLNHTAYGSRTQNYSCGMLVILMQPLETFFSKSWKICFQTYHQVNKMKLHACLTFPSSSTLLESECHHQVGFIKSSHALSAFILNSSEDSLTYFICIFWQCVYYWAFMTVFSVWCNFWIICSLSLGVHCSRVA